MTSFGISNYFVYWSIASAIIKVKDAICGVLRNPYDSPWICELLIDDFKEIIREMRFAFTGYFLSLKKFKYSIVSAVITSFIYHRLDRIQYDLMEY